MTFFNSDYKGEFQTVTFEGNIIKKIFHGSFHKVSICASVSWHYYGVRGFKLLVRASVRTTIAMWSVHVQFSALTAVYVTFHITAIKDFT